MSLSADAPLVPAPQSPTTWPRQRGSRLVLRTLVAVIACAASLIASSVELPAARAGHVPAAGPSTEQGRTADASHAAALFAAHSWYVAPPPPPPAVPPPPPPPEAPPFPYTFVGSYAPAGEQPVYFLARADRVIDAHVGDRLDGVYVFESAGVGTLVFNYLPLNIRQSVPTGVSP